MDYNWFLKSPKKEDEQEVRKDRVKGVSIWNDDFKAFLELSDEENPQHHNSNTMFYDSPLHWDLLMDHHHHFDHEFSLSETKTNHGGDVAEALGRLVTKDCSSDVGDDRVLMKKKKKKVSLNLNLNYEEVLEAWSGRGSLWAAGASLSDPSSATYMGEVPRMEEERRRRVVRYKEKRHTRLFSNKIRYQVRKLNADKRPRLKGRFAKTIS